MAYAYTTVDTALNGKDCLELGLVEGLNSFRLQRTLNKLESSSSLMRAPP